MAVEKDYENLIKKVEKYIQLLTRLDHKVGAEITQMEEAQEELLLIEDEYLKSISSAKKTVQEDVINSPDKRRLVTILEEADKLSKKLKYRIENLTDSWANTKTKRRLD